MPGSYMCSAAAAIETRPERQRQHPVRGGRVAAACPDAVPERLRAKRSARSRAMQTVHCHCTLMIEARFHFRSCSPEHVTNGSVLNITATHCITTMAHVTTASHLSMLVAPVCSMKHLLPVLE